MSDKLILKDLSRYDRGTFADVIYRNAVLYSHSEAFIYDKQRITFAQFNERVNRLIHGLNKLGSQKGDGIGILAWNCLEYTDFYGAAMKGGFIASPFNPRLHEEELEYIINYSEAKTLLVGPELISTVKSLQPRLSIVRNYISIGDAAPDMISYNSLLSNESIQEPDIEIHKDDPYLIFYTSGTTGLPRGALYTHERKLSSIRTKALEMGTKPEDKHIIALPFFH